MNHAFALLLTLCVSTIGYASDWVTWPSTYTHDSATMQRVNQYQPIAAPATAQVSDFQTSGYTHMRSSLNYGQSADNYHRVESWGPPVRPYGEWRFPYRPYSAPYAAWGAPYAGLNLGPNFYGGPLQNGGGPYGGPSNRQGPNHGWQPNTGQRPDNDWPSERHRHDPQSPFGAGSLNPYPFGPGTPAPLPPYYDGHYPNYRD